MKERILIVEDDTDVREVLQMVLTSYEFSVLTASNGKEALDLLKQGEIPSLVLLDIMMPVMTGWEFLEAKAADPKLAPIPVVVLSAADTSNPSARFAAAFVPKPINMDALIQKISEHCRK